MKNKNSKTKKNKGSFRDPSGYLYYEDGILLRNIQNPYKKHYEKIISSKLLKELQNKKFLINHKELNRKKRSLGTYKIIQPELIPFISYPYEWCFGQLKDAALLTLSIQKMALFHGMTLKDASAFNVQFKNGRPILIDTLSFEIYNKDTPWVAYKQFCQHFLAPLALMCHQDLRLNQLSRNFIDGIPLDLASSLLPKKSYLKFSLLSHIHLHAKSQKHYANKPNKGKASKTAKLSKHALLALISNLEGAITSLRPKEISTEWGNYYDATNYSDNSFDEKKKIIENFLSKSKNVSSVWDLGGNTGIFSRIASDKGIFTLSFDIDPIAVEKNYTLVKKQKEDCLLPLVLDLTNPSPNLGWAHEERESIEKRSHADLIMALAIIHHLCISGNLPFEKVAEYFSKLGENLIIEFVPKSDSNVKVLLATREDIFTDYDEKHFEQVFSKFYKIKGKIRLKDSERILYLMKTL